MKISLIGQFGSGNTGNDGSLEAMILSLRKLRPDAELLCICSNPKVVSARYGIPSMSVGGPVLSAPAARLVNRILFNVPRRLMLLCTALSRFNGIDLMIVPGTGILDDFQEHAFGWPLVLFFWCLAARLRNTKIAFVSIGAGPITGRFSRRLLSAAARMGTYRSYRDDTSLRFMTSLGIDVAKDHRYPDIAFSLPAPVPGPRPAVPGTSLNIGVGIMQYRGWRAGDPQAGRIYADYIGKISHLVAGLLREGHSISLFMGDVTDEHARDDILEALRHMVSVSERSRIETPSSVSLHDIMALVARVDLAVVSRYHNLVCSLKMGRPTISLGYARKNDDLMQAFDQQVYCRHIKTFDPDELLALVRRLIADRQGAGLAIDLVNARVRLQLADQQDLLQRMFLSEPWQRAMPDLPDGEPVLLK